MMTPKYHQHWLTPKLINDHQLQWPCFCNKIFENRTSQITLNRNNNDVSVNNYGYKLVDFCKCFSLFILNGRMEGDLPQGKSTCKNASCIDYFIGNVHMLNLVICLNVLDYCSLLSDSHNPVCLELNFNGNCINGEPENGISMQTRVKLWDSNESEHFSFNLAYQKINNIVNELSELETQENVSQTDINVILENISDVFLSSAEKSFGYVNNKTPVQIKKKTGNLVWVAV